MLETKIEAPTRKTNDVRSDIRCGKEGDVYKEGFAIQHAVPKPSVPPSPFNMSLKTTRIFHSPKLEQRSLKECEIPERERCTAGDVSNTAEPNGGAEEEHASWIYDSMHLELTLDPSCS